jgi:Protein of unknown function (DUF998)
LRGQEKEMKIPVAGSPEIVASPVTRHSMLKKVLLACGIVSSLFYACQDVLAGMQWQEYSWISQEFSRLSAIGAPSRPVILALNPIYSLLVVAFGLGVWWSAGRRRGLRVVGSALVLYALVSIVWPQFFPEDLTAPVSAFTNTIHIIIAGVTVFAWMLILGFGATVFGKRFRLCSIGTLVAVLLFGGVLTGQQAAAMIAGQPAPWLGLMERINLYSFMLWVVVLAIGLLRAPEGKEVSSPFSDAVVSQ